MAEIVKDKVYYDKLREKEKALHMDLDTNNDVNGRDLNYDGYDDFTTPNPRDLNQNGIDDEQESFEERIRRIKEETGLKEPETSVFDMAAQMEEERIREK